ncbi:MAG: enoyl-CoA hydratase-related protein [Alphaproteobacteria bacterium]|jgi:enoyl-CoA hydratase|nr:enoyl-CoA hydratase-related protein [Alphaproteobacteria bacterium]MDP6568146.1 enoyl-CoA hydratase-related protein [Alphaproteobacteria bacterium]MDP6812838.1 enoyl-CoA hydratase-related protein [Alphaproteobacteria bacterium]
MQFETILIGSEGPVATITMNRPEALNALSAQVFQDLADGLRELATDRTIRVVVIRGAGDRAFVAGADIKEMADRDETTPEERNWTGMRVYDQIRHLPQPVIASVHGYALGGGMLLAMACDIRIAADTATFGYPEIKLGIFPGTGGTVLIDRLIGPGTARAICLTGEHFPAERAYQLGIVTHLVPAAELGAETARLAELMAGYSPVAVRELKNALNASMEMDFEAARAAEVAAHARCFVSNDRIEGMRAFVEKRSANFTGD